MKVINGRQAFDLDSFLVQPLFAHLATVSQGEPRESPVWFLWEEEKIWIIGNQRTDTFPTRIKNNPKCAIGIVSYNQREGTVFHAGFRGYGKIVPFDTLRAKRLLKRYLGNNETLWDGSRFVEPLKDVDAIFVCFTPETVVVREQTYTVDSNQLFDA